MQAPHRVASQLFTGTRSTQTPHPEMSSQRKDPAPEITSFIEGLPEPHILLDLDYRIVMANRAYRERYAPQESVVGRRCYEVSHHFLVPCDQSGESCPRQAALASQRSERILHVHHTPRGEEHVQVQLSPVRDASGEIVFFTERMESLPTARATASPQGMVGRAPAFLMMLQLIARVAPSDTSVLLLGETGTGKEEVARAIHESSRRVNAPFVAVDCSGLTETLFENELFGHEKGAFTGAAARKVGLVEAARGGTLFLDEIGDISLQQQVKLLRLIETGTFRRVGAVEPQRSDVRLITATHRNLRAMVNDETFRRDLYYRISAYPIHLPALRERREDTPLLAESLLSRIQPGRTMKLSDGARRMLVDYDFPGNIRELRNILERASLLTDSDSIFGEHLPPEVLQGGSGHPAETPIRAEAAASEEAPLRAAEWQALEQALARHGGSRREAARALGISERTLYRKLASFGWKEPAQGH